MTSYAFMGLEDHLEYDHFRKPLRFINDDLGVSPWVLGHPLTIYSADQTQKHVFDGERVKVGRNCKPVIGGKLKSFVLTRKNGLKLYCTAQTYYEKGWLTGTPAVCLKSSADITKMRNSYTARSNGRFRREFFLPRCLVVISELPYFKLEVNLLRIHQQLRKEDCCITHPISPREVQAYLLARKTGQWQARGPRRRYLQAQIQIILDYYISKCHQNLGSEIIFYERSSRQPVLHLYRLNNDTLYQFTHVFNLPFQPQTTSAILNAILSQKQLVFCSQNINLTVMVIECFMQMILPLKWCHMYAPNMPTEMLEAASENFMPFIIGISKKSLASLNTDNYVVVDIDNKTVSAMLPIARLQPRLEAYLAKPVRTNNKFHGLELEKELRIAALMVMSILLEGCLSQSAPQLLAKYRKSLTNNNNNSNSNNNSNNNPNNNSNNNPNYKSNNNNNPNYNSNHNTNNNPNPNNNNNLQFYQQLYNNSMVSRLKEQHLRGCCFQFQTITFIGNHQQRQHFIRNKFETVYRQCVEPASQWNENHWMQYYLKRSKTKEEIRRPPRHSLSLKKENRPEQYQQVWNGSSSQSIGVANLSSITVSRVR